MEPRDLPFDTVYGILAAPPCTDFAGSGAQYWKTKDEDGRTKELRSMTPLGFSYAFFEANK